MGCTSDPARRAKVFNPSAGTVEATRISAILGGDTRTDHLGGDIATIRQEALSDKPSITVDIQDITVQPAARDEPPQCSRGRSTTWMVPFGRVEAPDADPA